jgi:hypothetical protein
MEGERRSDRDVKYLDKLKEQERKSNG